MKIDRRGLTYRLIVGICLAFSLVTAAIFVIGHKIILDIVEDYHHLIADYHASETRQLFETSIAELTSARLLGSPEVLAAKQEALIETLRQSWRDRQVDGVLIDANGATLATTFPPELTQRLTARFNQDFVEVMEHGNELFGPVEQIHPWEWRVMTVATDKNLKVAGRMLPLVVPLMILGPVIMLVSLLLILRRQVQQPVNRMVRAMIHEEAVDALGVTEFDHIGEAFNASQARTRERSLALQAEKNKFEAMIAGMGDGVSIQDKNYTVLYQNEVHKGFIGAHQGETCYQAYERNDDICPGCPVALAMADGKVHSAERRVVPPGEDAPRYFEITASPLRDGSGVIIGGIELVRDVTERRKAEEQLIQAQKMEGIGHLAGGVAHDFNNVLNVVQGYADLLQVTRPDDTLVSEYAEYIQEAVRRGSTITRQILAFTR